MDMCHCTECTLTSGSINSSVFGCFHSPVKSDLHIHATETTHSMMLPPPCFPLSIVLVLKESHFVSSYQRVSSSDSKQIVKVYCRDSWYSGRTDHWFLCDLPGFSVWKGHCAHFWHTVKTVQACTLYTDVCLSKLCSGSSGCHRWTPTQL